MRTILAVLLVAILAGPAVVADAKPRPKTACERLRGKDLAPAKLLKVVKREGVDGSSSVLACTLRGGKVRTIASYVVDGEFASGTIEVGSSGDRLVLHRAGPVAAILQPLPPCCGPTAGPAGPAELVRLAADGTTTVLDEGPGLAGLRLEGDEAAWTRDGAEQRAPIR